MNGNGEGQAVLAPAVPGQSPASGGKRPTPTRRAELAHLSLEELRDYRTTLTDEEGRVSYWRRVIQARLDLVRSIAEGTVVSDNLRDVLSGVQVWSSRGALATFVDDVALPPLPNLPDLWSRDPRPGDTEHNTALALELAAAEAQLSSYRSLLHERLEAATSELIARYREEPALCLIALPGTASV